MRLCPSSLPFKFNPELIGVLSEHIGKATAHNMTDFRVCLLLDRLGKQLEDRLGILRALQLDLRPLKLSLLACLQLL